MIFLLFLGTIALLAIMMVLILIPGVILIDFIDRRLTGRIKGRDVLKEIKK